MRSKPCAQVIAPADTYRSVVRAVAVCVGSVAFALGLRAAGAESPYTLAIHLETDRPDYVVGQPVRVRFVITTETTLSYPSTYVPDLEIVDSQNKRLQQTSPVDDPSRLVGPARMGPVPSR
jgi:hypothetical protein